MKTTQVTDGVYRLSANVDNIKFEGLWPIPNGIAMNSYIVKGEKVAIIDGVCDWDGVPETLFEQFDQMNVKAEDIDYVIINHMEPDHSGWLQDFKKIRPNFTIYTSERAKALLDAFYGIDELGNDIVTVKSGDTLDLGDGRVLAFEEIPNVHWPETIATFDTKSGTLFPCDAFGSFGSITDAPYDDNLTQDDIEYFEHEALRYYANIVAAFSYPVIKAAKKVDQLPVQIISPGHGIVWRKNPEKIVNDYKRYASYSKGPAEPEVTVIWGSMYGNTERAVVPVVRGIESKGVKVHVHRVPETHMSYILRDIWRSSGVVLGMPTYEYGMFPPMKYVMELLKEKIMRFKKVGFFGSFGWSGGAKRDFDELKENMKWDIEEPLLFKGYPSDEEREKGEELGRTIARKVKEIPSKIKNEDY